MGEACDLSQRRFSRLKDVLIEEGLLDGSTMVYQKRTTVVSTGDLETCDLRDVVVSFGGVGRGLDVGLSSLHTP